MATVYYKRLYVTRIDASGNWVAVPSITLNVYNITAAASLGTKAVDANSFLPEGSVTATAGDIIEFSHATYPLTIRQTVTATQDEAYTHVDNSPATYIVENLDTTTTESATGDVYAQDLDNLDTKPFLLGTIQAGVTNYLPYQSSVAKNLRLYLVSKDSTGRLSAVDLEKDAEQVDLAIPALSGSGGVESLFDFYSDQTTAGTSEESLYDGLVEAGQLGANGDKIEAFFHGDLAANAHTKEINCYVAGMLVGGISTTQSGKPWLFDIEIIRVSNSVLRVSLDMMVSNSPLAGYAEVTGLDLANDDITIQIKATTASAAGDVTARMGNAVYFPAAPVSAVDYLLSEDGEYLFSEGGSALTAE